MKRNATNRQKAIVEAFLRERGVEGAMIDPIDFADLFVDFLDWVYDYEWSYAAFGLRDYDMEHGNGKVVEEEDEE